MWDNALHRRAGPLAFLAVCFVALTAVSTSSPIPFDIDGHVILPRGSPGAALKVEVFLDLACTDCAAAWPVLTQVTEQYSKEAEFLYRLFPLPYHRNAFTAAQAAQVVRLYSSGDERAIASFFTMVFDGQEKILNRATVEMTQAQVEDIFANWATSTGVVSLEDFRSGLADGELNMKARYEFKYSCLHTVYGTPAVYIGGIFAQDLDGGSTIEDWQKTLDPLLERWTPKIDF